MRYGSFFLLLLLACSACSEKGEQSARPLPAAKPDSAVAVDTPRTGVPSVGGAPESDEHRLFKVYARVAAKVPRHTLDSILGRQKSPAEIEAAMKTYLQHRDTLVRKFLAQQNGISVDSLNALIDRGNAEKW